MSISVRELARRTSIDTGRSVSACRAEIRRYGYAAHKELHPTQEGCCAVCGAGGKLVVDHSHVTGAVRGLLCSACNTGLGLFKDSPVRLRNAIEYLKNPPALGRLAQPTIFEAPTPLAQDDTK